MDYFNIYYFLIYNSSVNSQCTEKEINGILEKCKPDKNSICLDVGCAWGRHTQHLSKLGYKCIGLDNSNFFINIAEKRRKVINLNNLIYLRSDARLIPIKNNTIDTIFNINTSFGFFMDDGENEHIFKEIYRVLKNGGNFLFDYYNPEKYCCLPTKNWIEINGDNVRDGFKDDPILYEMCKIFIKKSFYILENSDYKVNNSILDRKRIIIDEYNNKKSIKQYKLRLYPCCEIKKMLIEAGFSISKIYGSLIHKNITYSKNSKRLVILCKKNR